MLFYVFVPLCVVAIRNNVIFSSQC